MKLSVIGCGPAGLFAAISAAKTAPELNVCILERESQPLRWMNDARNPPALTRADDSPDAFAAACPHGADFMHGAVQALPPSILRESLGEMGVRTRVGENGAVLPAEGLDAQRISATLLDYAKRLGIEVVTGCTVAEMNRGTDCFRIWPKSGPSLDSDFVILATGGRAGQSGWNLARSFGHEPSAWVPSPVLLKSKDARARVSSPIPVDGATARIPELSAEAGGGVCLLPNGIGGAAVLELAARYSHELAARQYRMTLEVNWVAGHTRGQPTKLLRQIQQSHARKTVMEDAVLDLPRKLWEKLVESMKLPAQSRWSALDAAQLQALAGQLVSSRFKIDGRAMNKAEWVASGGVPLVELDPVSLQSLRQKGLFMAGEMLDIDAIAGGWNMHIAWTTGWIAGSAVAAEYGHM